MDESVGLRHSVVACALLTIATLIRNRKSELPLRGVGLSLGRCSSRYRAASCGRSWQARIGGHRTGRRGREKQVRRHRRLSVSCPPVMRADTSQPAQSSAFARVAPNRWLPADGRRSHVVRFK